MSRKHRRLTKMTEQTPKEKLEVLVKQKKELQDDRPFSKVQQNTKFTVGKGKTTRKGSK